MAKNIGVMVGVLFLYIILIVLFAYVGALAGIVVGLATSNVLFGGASLITLFAWIGVGLAHILFIFALIESYRDYVAEQAYKSIELDFEEISKIIEGINEKGDDN